MFSTRGGGRANGFHDAEQEAQISHCLNAVYPHWLSKIFKSPPSENFLSSSSDFSLNPIGQEDVTTRKAESTNHHIGFLCQDLSLMNLNVPVYWPASLDVQVKCVERKKKTKEKPECDLSVTACAVL